MKKLRIEGSVDTPEILFDHESGVFEISGRSLPEDCVEFYKPVLEWIAQYSEKPNATTEFTFKLEYMNTASSKLIQDIISSLEELKGAKVIWYCREDDEDMIEIGQELSEIIQVPFEFKTME